MAPRWSLALAGSDCRPDRSRSRGPRGQAEAKTQSDSAIDCNNYGDDSNGLPKAGLLTEWLNLVALLADGEGPDRLSPLGGPVQAGGVGSEGVGSPGSAPYAIQAIQGSSSRGKRHLSFLPR